MGLSIGIVGLPNVGKSTLFNALARLREGAGGELPVLHHRAERRAWCRCPTSGSTSSPQLFKPKKTMPTTLEFVDIAGLVRGASKGEGLGNQFLAQHPPGRRGAHVLRCFEDDNVIHVEGGVDPRGDRDVVDTELCSRTSRRSRSAASGRRRTPRRPARRASTRRRSWRCSTG